MNKSISQDEINKGLIISFLKGELTSEEEVSVLDWINHSEENETIFIEYRNIWMNSAFKNPKREIFNSQSAWNKTESLLNSTKSKTINWFTIAKIASVVILIFLLGVASTLFLKPMKSESSRQLCEIVTPLGSKSIVTLPDSTVVWLNAGSRLTYLKDFNEKTRLVSLEGEAFFKVKTNKKKPFVVNAFGLKVNAVGTAFNVKAYPNDKSIIATLVEGVIKVEGKGFNQKSFAYTLKPNQNIIYVRDSKLIESEKSTNEGINHEKNKGLRPEVIPEEILLNDNIRTEILTSWKDKHWIIEGEELENLATLLERRYNVVVHFKSKELKSFKFSGTIENETIEQVMEILKLTTPLKFEFGKGEVWWDIDNKLVDKYSRILSKK